MTKSVDDILNFHRERVLQKTPRKDVKEKFEETLNLYTENELKSTLS